MRHLVRLPLGLLLTLVLTMPGCLTMATHYELGDTTGGRGMAVALTPVTFAADVLTLPFQLPFLALFLDFPNFGAVH